MLTKDPSKIHNPWVVITIPMPPKLISTLYDISCLTGHLLVSLILQVEWRTWLRRQWTSTQKAWQGVSGTSTLTKVSRSYQRNNPTAAGTSNNAHNPSIKKERLFSSSCPAATFLYGPRGREFSRVLSHKLSIEMHLNSDVDQAL